MNLNKSLSNLVAKSVFVLFLFFAAFFTSVYRFKELWINELLGLLYVIIVLLLPWKLEALNVAKRKLFLSTYTAVSSSEILLCLLLSKISAVMTVVCSKKAELMFHFQNIESRIVKWPDLKLSKFLYFKRTTKASSHCLKIVSIVDPSAFPWSFVSLRRVISTDKLSIFKGVVLTIVRNANVHLTLYSPNRELFC